MGDLVANKGLTLYLDSNDFDGTVQQPWELLGSRCYRDVLLVFIIIPLSLFKYVRY